MLREIPLYTSEGVKNATMTPYFFNTDDKLGLSFLRFSRGTADEAVLIIHGLTTSSDMFIMPEHENLVSYLLDNGFNDLWCLDFRMSNRHSYNLFRTRYTMDDVALFDIPPALQLMRAHIGDKPVHVICHCLGSVSFMMSLFGGAVSGIRSVISNSVSLTPRVPAWSNVKLRFAPFLVESVLGFPYLNPLWSEDPGFSWGRLFSKAVSAVHKECDVPACHMLSLMWGSGRPALYNHENLAELTHRRSGDLYGAVSVHYYRHVRKMVAAGQAVKFDPSDLRYDRLSGDFFRRASEIETPVLFVTGDQNRVFADSNIVCYNRLEKLVPGRHEVQVFRGYGHQDPFMGKNVAQEIFPRFLEFLEKKR